MSSRGLCEGVQDGGSQEPLPLMVLSVWMQRTEKETASAEMKSCSRRWEAVKDTAKEPWANLVLDILGSWVSSPRLVSVPPLAAQGKGNPAEGSSKGCRFLPCSSSCPRSKAGHSCSPGSKQQLLPEVLTAFTFPEGELPFLWGRVGFGGPSVGLPEARRGSRGEFLARLTFLLQNSQTAPGKLMLALCKQVSASGLFLFPEYTDNVLLPLCSDRRMYIREAPPFPGKGSCRTILAHGASSREILGCSLCGDSDVMAAQEKRKGCT